MDIKIDLPKCGEWDSTENYAKNLRMSRGGGCVPTGIPAVAVADAGVESCLIGDRVLSVGDDRHELRLDGVAVGSLGDVFRAVLPTDDGAIVFTDSGPEWLVGATLHGGAPQTAVTLRAERGGDLSEQVTLPALKGQYPRSEGELSAVDVPGVLSAVRETLGHLQTQASGGGARVQPVVAAWRLLDADGRVVARGTPVSLGLGVQGGDTMRFSASHSGNSMTIEGTALMTVATWRLKVDVSASASDFWRERIVRLEVIAADFEDVIRGVGGRFVSVNSSESRLVLSAVTAPEEAEAEAMARIESQGRVVAVIENPLGGFSGDIGMDADGAVAAAGVALETLKPTGAWSFGSMTVYAAGDSAGTLLTAQSADPLQPIGREKVCRGRIMSVTTPVGSGGGWNYGRHHLLVFATDGIYGVSVDRTLKVMTSTLLHPYGVGRRDGVVATPQAVYVATDGGLLLRLKGSRAEEVETPFAAVAVTYVGEMRELWLLGADGRIATIDSCGRCTQRTDLTVTGFPIAGYATDRANALRALAREGNEAVVVEWGRNMDAPLGGVHGVSWRLESAQAIGLRLTLTGDSGGTPQRLLELMVEGTVNAPVSTRFVSPPRLRLSAKLRGGLAYPSRLRSVSVRG